MSWFAIICSAAIAGWIGFVIYALAFGKFDNEKLRRD
jgi:hypothetical protein